MPNEPDHPAFVEVVEKASDISLHNVVHLLLQERVRQRIQRLMLAASRAKPIREVEKILFVYLVEDGDHGVLDELIFQGRDPYWMFQSICFIDVYPFRGQRSIRAA